MPYRRTPQSYRGQCLRSLRRKRSTRARLRPALFPDELAASRRLFEQIYRLAAGRIQNPFLDTRPLLAIPDQSKHVRTIHWPTIDQRRNGSATGEMASQDRQSKKFGGSDRFPSRLGAIRNVFQELHAQTMAAWRQGSRSERLRPHPNPHKSRRSLFI